MRVIDSSTIVKFFSLEPGWESTRDYVQLPATIELAILELANALGKKTRSGLLDSETAVEVLDKFDRIAFYFDQREYIGKAFVIATSSNITIYDALFIAVASVEGSELVTSDGRQALVARKEGVQTIEC